MGGNKIKRSMGEDMGGTTIRSRFEKREERLMEASKASRMPRGTEPTADIRVSGSKVANTGSFGDSGFKVFVEKADGRKGGRGKRV